MQFLLYKPYSFLSDIFAINVFLYLYHYHLQKEIVKSAVILLFWRTIRAEVLKRAEKLGNLIILLTAEIWEILSCQD